MFAIIGTRLTPSERLSNRGMSSFTRRIRPFVFAEFAAATRAEASGDAAAAFAHLERAHVLGQRSTLLHVQAHFFMLLWAVRQRSRGEFFGQVVRVIGAATKTIFGLVPSGNTGGSNVSPFRKLPVPPELARLIEQAVTRS